MVRAFLIACVAACAIASPSWAAEPVVADAAAESAELAPYRAYAARCKIHFEQTVSHAQKIRPVIKRDLAKAEGALVGRGEIQSSKRGLQMRFASEEAKQEKIEDLTEQLAMWDRVLAMRGHKWLPAPLPLPAKIHDMGTLLQDAQVLALTSDEALLKVKGPKGVQYLAFRGDTRGFEVGAAHQFASDQILRATGTAQLEADDQVRRMIVLVEDDLIALTPLLREAFGIK